MPKLFCLHDNLLNVDTTSFVFNSNEEAMHAFVKQRCEGMSLFLLANMENIEGELTLTAATRELIMDYDEYLKKYEERQNAES